jgi:WD40 repeat protein
LILQGCSSDNKYLYQSIDQSDNLQNYFPSITPGFELIIKTGHKLRIGTFAISPDGKILISTDVAGKVKVWDVKTGQFVRDLETFPDAVYSSCFSSDGKYFAAASFRGDVRVWEMPGYRMITDLKKFANSLAFSHNSKYLAAAHYGDSIKILSAPDFKIIKDFGLKMDDITSLAFSPDSKLVASGHGSGNVEIWDVKTGKIIKSLDGLYFWVSTVRFSPDGKKLLGASYLIPLGGKWKELYRIAYKKEPFDEDKNEQDLPGDNAPHSEKYDNVIKNGRVPDIKNPNTDVVMWDVSTGKQILSYPHPKSAYCADFSKDGKFFASVGADNRLCVKETATDKTIASYIVENAKFLNYLIFTPDGNNILFAGGDSVIRLYNFRKKVIVREFGRCENLVQSVAFSPDGNLLASGGEDKLIRIWNIKDKELSNVFGGNRKAIQEVRFDKTGDFLMSASSDASITVWRKAENSNFQLYKGFEGVHPFLSVDVSPDLKTMAAGDAMGYVTFWDFETGRQIRRIKTHRESILCVRFTPDGGRLLVSSHNEFDDTIKLIETASGKELKRFSGEGHPAWSLCFIPGTDTFLFAGGSFIKKADLNTGKIIDRYKADRGAVWTISISSDGKNVISGGFRGEINIWDINTFKNISSFGGSQGEIESLSYSPDGSFASAGSESSIKIWSGKSDKPDYTIFGFTNEQWIIFREDGNFKSSPDVFECVGGAIIKGKSYKFSEFLSRFRVNSF